MEAFDWLPTECAENVFPVEIVRGDFFISEQDSVYIPRKTIVNNGWGEIGSIHIAGDGAKPLPKKLLLSWFSFAEDKFFSCSFNLPLSRLVELFQTGFFSPVTKKQSTYKRILVGMSLEGGVSLWTSGDGIVRHVADFVANESQGDWSEILNNKSIAREEYIISVMEAALGVEKYAELESKGLPKGHWSKIMSQYRWELEIHGVDIMRIWIKTLNGEKEFHDYESGHEHIEERETRACPLKLRIDWRSTEGIYYSTDILLDATKNFVLFKKMSSESQDEKMTLQVEMDPLQQTADTVLRNSQSFIPLEVISCRTFRS